MMVFFPIFCCKKLVDFSLKITNLVEFTLGVKIPKTYLWQHTKFVNEKIMVSILLISNFLEHIFFNCCWYEHAIRGRALTSVKAVTSLLRTVG
jgi:hypothetical protein